MKKRFVWIILIVVLGALLSSFLFLPSKIAVTQSAIAETTQGGAYRVLANSSKWEKWWKDGSGNSPAKDAPLTYDGYTFQLTDHQTNIVGVDISKGGLKLKSIIHLLTVRYDSLIVLWQTDTLVADANPVTRYAYYKDAADIQKCMKGILQNFKRYVANPVNVYDCSIYRTSTEDTTMLSAKFISKTYPTTTELYGYFDVVTKSILKQKGFVKSFPLMDVRKLGKDSFETQVAIPTNIQLKDDGKVFYRRMEPGNFVATNIMGGPYSTEQGMKQLMNFISDYNGQIMAKSFQILVTDRTLEPDTTKWLTKLYIPVVE